MAIVLTYHAMRRIQERNISLAEVHYTVINPRWQTDSAEKVVAMRIRQNGQLLVVYYVKDADICRVVTVISTSKINKHLGNA